MSDCDCYMRVNQDRILTLQVKITEPDKAKGAIPEELEDDDE